MLGGVYYIGCWASFIKAILGQLEIKYRVEIWTLEFVNSKVNY